jgi:aldehyde oxidoreductase
VVNGKATRSCLAKVTDVEGTEVITVEGLGTPQNPHLIQEAFVLSGQSSAGIAFRG